MKRCHRCGLEKELLEFHKAKRYKFGVSSRCKACCREITQLPENKKYRKLKQKEYRTSGKYDKQYNRKIKLKYHYGLTETEFIKILASQDGGCAICGIMNLLTRKKNLNIDHDHKTKRVRGLLCTNCNLGLGNFKDNPVLLMKAIQYLYDHETLPIDGRPAEHRGKHEQSDHNSGS